MAFRIGAKILTLIFVSSVSTGSIKEEELEVGTGKKLTKVKELGVDAIVLEQRGALLTRLGTLIGYSASAMAITIVKIPLLLKPEAYAETYNVLDVILQDGQASSLHYCAEYLSVIYSYYRKQTEQLEDATAMIFKTKTQFSHVDLCKAFDGYECKHANRNKRFLDPVGAGMAAAALAMARESQNELEKINQWMNEQTAKQNALEQRLQEITGLVDNNIKATEKLFGFVRANQVNIEALKLGLNCLQLQINYQKLVDDIIRNLKEVVAFILEGTTYGRLTPQILPPQQLQFVVDSTIGKSSKFYRNNYNVLYQTATAYLVKANFTSNLFTFLIRYPDIETASLLPIYTLQQVGFWGKNNDDNTSICLQFHAPEHVVLHQELYYILNTASPCNTFGSVVMCAKAQYKLTSITNCLRITETEGENCPLVQCGQSAFISTPAGVLIRTMDKHITIVSHSVTDLAATVNITVPEHRTIFVKWNKNVSSVHFENRMIYSPKSHMIQMVEKKIFNTNPVLNWTDLLEIPSLGARQLDKELQRYKKEIMDIRQTIEDPDKLLGTITNIPKYITAGIYVLIILVIIGMGCKLKQFMDCCFPAYKNCFNTTAQLPVVSVATVPQTQILPPTTEYVPIYPIIQEEMEPTYQNTVMNEESDIIRRRGNFQVSIPPN